MFFKKRARPEISGPTERDLLKADFHVARYALAYEQANDDDKRRLFKELAYWQKVKAAEDFRKSV